MSVRKIIDPALGLDLKPARTLKSQAAKVSVVIPAHNEAATIEEVVTDCLRGLELLKVDGEVLVSASGCTDETASIAVASGARAVDAPIGKGAAIKVGLDSTDGDVVCLIDGDVRYFGNPPLVTILVDPILRGVADACITDLYWRPLYPQMWLHAFFAPLAGYLFPEMLPKVGFTPWSGQRAARRELWPESLPDGFTSDLEILLHWNEHALRLHPIVSDDWVNPQRPKHDLMAAELDVLIHHALERGRISEPGTEAAIRRWYETAHSLMATYEPDHHNPQEFEKYLLDVSVRELHAELRVSD